MVTVPCPQVECVDESGAADAIRVTVVTAKSSLPVRPRRDLGASESWALSARCAQVLSAVVNMPLAEMLLSRELGNI